MLRHSQGLSLSGEKSRTWLSVLRTWRCKKLRPPSGRSALRSSFPQLTGRRRSPSLSASWPSCSQKTCGLEAVVGMLKLERPALSGFVRFRARRVTRCCRRQEREVSSFLTRTRQRPRAYGGCLEMTRSLQRFVCKQLRSRQRWPPPLAFRRGGRASLGIVGEGTTVAESSGLRLRWAAKSVPRHWSPTQFRRMLDVQTWRVVADLQPPARPGGVCTFAAARPEGRSEDCFVEGLQGLGLALGHSQGPGGRRCCCSRRSGRHNGHRRGRWC